MTFNVPRTCFVSIYSGDDEHQRIYFAIFPLKGYQISATHIKQNCNKINALSCLFAPYLACTNIIRTVLDKYLNKKEVLENIANDATKDISYISIKLSNKRTYLMNSENNYFSLKISRYIYLRVFTQLFSLI